MKRLTVLTFCVLLIGCPKEQNPPEIGPPLVEIKHYNGDTSHIDRGSRAEEGSNRIRLEWKPVVSENIIEEYQIFRAPSLDSAFTLLASRPITFTSQDSFYTDEVNIDSTYYYFVVARDSKDNISDTSEYFRPENLGKYVFYFALGQKTNNLNPNALDTVVTTKPRLLWCLTAQPPLRYIVKIASSSNQVVWVGYKQSATFNASCDPADQEFLTVNPASYSVTMLGDSLRANADVFVTYFNPSFFVGGRLKKGIYQWSVSCYFDTHKSSRSAWTAFIVNRD